jgi:hypothetical protein
MTYDDPCAQCGQVHPGCRGHKKNDPGAGLPCMRPCKQGEICRAHGGGAPQVKAARARREQEAEAARQVATLGLPIDISPTEALLQEVQWTAGHVHWLRQKVQELDDDRTNVVGPEGDWEAQEVGAPSPLVWGTKAITRKDSGQFPGVDTTSAASPSVWYELYAKERQHLVMVCSAALKAGVEERRVRLAESQGDLVATAIRRILDALGLTEAQQALVGTVVPRELRLIAGGTA